MGHDRHRLSEAERRRITVDLFPEGLVRRQFVGRFASLMTLSVVIAVLGLMADSTAVVIGAMLVAPLMLPVLDMAAAIVRAWPRRLAVMALITLGGTAGGVLPQLDQWHMAAGAMLLFTADVVGIVMSAATIFIVSGFVPVHQLLHGDRRITNGLHLSAAAVLIVTLPLSSGYRADPSPSGPDARVAVDLAVSRVAPSLTVVETNAGMRAEEAVIDLVVTEPEESAEPIDTDPVAELVADELEQPVGPAHAGGHHRPVGGPGRGVSAPTLRPMTTTDSPADSTGAEEVAWDLEPLVDGHGAAGVTALLDRAMEQATALTADARGQVGDADAPTLAGWLDRQAEISDAAHRAASYAELRFATDVSDPERGALVAQVHERLSELGAELVWLELEWLAIDDEQADALLDDPALAPHRHHLDTARVRRPHVLSEAEERILAVKTPTGQGAWVRLFTEQTSAIRVALDGDEVPLDAGLARLLHPDRDVRRTAAAAVTDGLAPGLGTRAYIFNTLLSDKSIDDRLRDYPTWITSWNQGNEASDESVRALIDAVVARYDLPRRWYALKARVLGIDRLADYDRSSSVARTDVHVPWAEACTIVRDAYASFSGELAEVVDRFLTEGWIDAPVRAAKRGGAFCAYTVPSHHPYVFLNYTATPSDVLTLAHELGHAVHGYVARPQGIFHQSTPLTLAETASVFGETVTFERMLEHAAGPGERFALLAQQVEGNIATVFRQVAMNRFEDAVHTHRREVGELSVDDFAEHWVATQADLFGDTVEITDGYRSWWSYIPHFIGTPGYVYAYAYGQLLALSVYARYQDEGPSFVPSYLELLAAGGSRRPEDLAAIVGCDLTDPGFWSSGLGIVDTQIARAEAAAADAGRI